MTALPGIRFSAVVAVLVLVAACGALGPWLAPHDPNAVDVVNRLQPPGDGHLLGTDQLGRDVLSRLILGARVSLAVALATVCISGAIGLIVACVAGYGRGAADFILMRLADTALAFPVLVFVVAMASVLGAGLLNVILVLSLFFWANFARVLRSDVIRLAQEPYVAAAQVAGVGRVRIFLRHILPNLVETFFPLAVLYAGYMVVAEAGLSFLGLGVVSPTPSWGSMLSDGSGFPQAWWLSIAPGVALVVTVLALNTVASRISERWRGPHERPVGLGAAVSPP